MDEKKHGLQLTGNQLKIIAIAAMTLDHCVAVFMPQDMVGRWILRMLGRMAAPIMCYLIAEGYYHTSNLKKYMGRLLLVAVISHIPYNLCFGYDVWRFWEATDVMVALFAGLAALAAFEKKELPLWLRLFIVAGCCLFAYSANWNYIAVLWILGFGVFLVIPLLLCYSGRRGRQSRLFKWAFYWFYPVHLWIIYLVQQFA